MNLHLDGCLFLWMAPASSKCHFNLWEKPHLTGCCFMYIAEAQGTISCTKRQYFRSVNRLHLPLRCRHTRDKLAHVGHLHDIQNCGLCMPRECRERFSAPPRVSDPDMHHGTCVTRAVMHVGVVNYRFPLKSVALKKVLAFPTHAQLAFLRIW